MEKRGLILGTYSTADHGWTLQAGWRLTPAEQKTNYIEKPSGDGSWDLSTALTDDIPKYKTRTLTATFECSEGSRLEREAKISEMVNLLDGRKETIKLPDDSYHYVVGRLHVAKEYNDLAHGSVTVTAVCEPWRYSVAETVVGLTASTTKRTVKLTNRGKRATVPTIKVEGTNASVLLEYGGATTSLSAGTYQWPNLLLTQGTHEVVYSGTGSLVVTYREAVLE